MRHCLPHLQYVVVSLKHAAAGPYSQHFIQITCTVSGLIYIICVSKYPAKLKIYSDTNVMSMVAICGGFGKYAGSHL